MVRRPSRINSLNFTLWRLIMKHLKALLVAKSIAAVAIAASGISAPLAAHASEQDGATCGADTQATLVNGVLKCKKQKVLASICSPVAFGNTPKLNPNIVMNPSGSDTCLPGVTGNITPSLMAPPTPGIDPPASAFHRVINPTGPDTFVAEFYVFPSTGLNPVYPLAPPADASHGVACPSGFNAVGINGGRGLRCEATQVKVATCDGMYHVKHIAGKDQCVATVRDPFGNPIAEVTGEYTIPADVGYVGIGGNPQEHGWTLDIDHAGTTDYWASQQKSFKFPVAL
jgi:hypothetical protein